LADEVSEAGFQLDDLVGVEGLPLSGRHGVIRVDGELEG